MNMGRFGNAVFINDTFSASIFELGNVIVDVYTIDNKAVLKIKPSIKSASIIIIMIIIIIITKTNKTRLSRRVLFKMARRDISRDNVLHSDVSIFNSEALFIDAESVTFLTSLLHSPNFIIYELGLRFRGRNVRIQHFISAGIL